MGKSLKSLVEDWLNSHLTVDGVAKGFICIKGARGGGRIHAAAQRYGYDQLILLALRIRLRYPLGCPDIDRYIERLLWDREYSTKYYFTDLFDPAAVTLRKGDSYGKD